MKRKKGSDYVWEPRFIDKVVLGVLGTLHLANGAYLIGPWYLDTWVDEGKAPLQTLFNSGTAVAIYGAFLFFNGLFLYYASAGRTQDRWYTPIVKYTLLTGFLARFYSLIGVVIVLESWRPPSYLSHTATVLILGSYWVWVKVDTRNVRPI